MAAKMTSVVVPVLAAMVTWLFVTFETASGAEQKWVQHNQAISCRTVYAMQAEIRRYLERLKRDVELTEADQNWINQEIEALQKDIQRIDPEGVC